MIVNDYKANDRSSLSGCEDSIAHLRSFFGDYKAADMTSDLINGAYVAMRKDEKAANATVNKELAAVGRML